MMMTMTMMTMKKMTTGTMTTGHTKDEEEARRIKS